MLIQYFILFFGLLFSQQIESDNNLVELNNDLPEYLVNNKNKYSEFII